MSNSKLLINNAELETIAAFGKRINNFLDDYFVSEIANAQSIDRHYADLWQVIYEVAKAGGKRLRPYLVLLGYAMSGGEAYSELVPVAAAQELLHQCFLIHDDIIDRDDIRHGTLNVTGRLKQVYRHADRAHYATSAAILAGDILLSSSYQLVNDSKIDPKLKKRIIRRMGESVFNVGAGELLDTESAMRPISETDTIKIALLKTASYSFVIPLLCGAELASANPAILTSLRVFGENLGIAYQLEDDLLGIFGDEQQTGKSSSNDIREGKRTLLIQLALKRANKIESLTLQNALGNPLITKAEIGEVKAIVTSTGARDLVTKDIDLYMARARKSIAAISMSQEAAIKLDTLLTQLNRRAY